MSNPAGIVADSSAPALSAQLDEEWSALAELGAGLTDGEWSAATPCPGWTVAAQYAHIIGTESSLLGWPNPEAGPDLEGEPPPHVRNPIGAFNELWVAEMADQSRTAVLGRFAEVTDARRQALAQMDEEDFAAPSWTPVGQADYRRFMQIRIFDCWVHEQDIRDAVERPGHEAGPVAEQSVDEIVRALGYLVGKKAAAPPGASVRFDLTGPVRRRLDVSVIDGRARVVSGLEAQPTASIALSSGAFTRLACGRVGSEEVLNQRRLGGAKLSGDTELASRVVENLAFTI